MEYNNPSGLFHKPLINNNLFDKPIHSHLTQQPRKTLRRAPSAPVRSRYRDTFGGHSRRDTLPDLNIADSDKQAPPHDVAAAAAQARTTQQHHHYHHHHQLGTAASANDLHRLSEASGELHPSPQFGGDLRPDSLAIFSSHSFVKPSPSTSPHLRPLGDARSTQPSPLSRPSAPPRSQTTGRISLRHTLSTRGLKRPSIIGIMDGVSPRSHNGSNPAPLDGTSSPRQRYSDEIKIKKKNGIGSFMAGLMKSNSRPAISAPANPLHVVHVGVDSTTGEFTVRRPL